MPCGTALHRQAKRRKKDKDRARDSATAGEPRESENLKQVGNQKHAVHLRKGSVQSKGNRLTPRRASVTQDSVDQWTQQAYLARRYQPQCYYTNTRIRKVYSFSKSRSCPLQTPLGSSNQHLNTARAAPCLKRVE